MLTPFFKIIKCTVNFWSGQAYITLGVVISPNPVVLLFTFRSVIAECALLKFFLLAHVFKYL